MQTQVFGWNTTRGMGLAGLAGLAGQADLVDNVLLDFALLFKAKCASQVRCGAAECDRNVKKMRPAGQN